MQQIAFSTRYEDLLAEEAPGRGMADDVDDLDDQLIVICGLANLGAEASHDAGAENYFTLIESAGERAAQITRQLRELDPRAQHAIDATIGPRQFGSSFRRRVTAARTSHEG
jgi:hypothetical protein